MLQNPSLGVLMIQQFIIQIYVAQVQIHVEQQKGIVITIMNVLDISYVEQTTAFLHSPIMQTVAMNHIQVSKNFTQGSLLFKAMTKYFWT